MVVENSSHNYTVWLQVQSQLPSKVLSLGFICTGIIFCGNNQPPPLCTSGSHPAVLHSPYQLPQSLMQLNHLPGHFNYPLGRLKHHLQSSLLGFPIPKGFVVAVLPVRLPSVPHFCKSFILMDYCQNDYKLSVFLCLPGFINIM